MIYEVGCWWMIVNAFDWLKWSTSKKLNSMSANCIFNGFGNRRLRGCVWQYWIRHRWLLCSEGMTDSWFSKLMHIMPWATATRYARFKLEESSQGIGTILMLFIESQSGWTAAMWKYALQYSFVYHFTTFSFRPIYSHYKCSLRRQS